MTLKEFIEEQKKVTGPRVHKIKGSLGVYDAYRWIRKNKWLNIGRPLKTEEFYDIIREVNKYLAKELIEGNDVVFPERMGEIGLRRRTPFIKFDSQNKLKTDLKVDWNATLKLWYEDEESFNERKLVRMEEKDIFKVYYNKHPANYKNKFFYEFRINRDIKVKLKEQIKAGQIDAFTQGYVK